MLVRTDVGCWILDVGLGGFPNGFDMGFGEGYRGICQLPQTRPPVAVGLSLLRAGRLCAHMTDRRSQAAFRGVIRPTSDQPEDRCRIIDVCRNWCSRLSRS